MKIFATTNFTNSFFESRPIVSILPDSVIFRENNPFYLPESDSSFSAIVGLVIKINRFGKCVSPKFTDRYVSHIGVAIKFIAKDLYNKLLAANVSPDWATAFDNSMAMSVQREIVEDDLRSFKMKVSYNGDLFDFDSSMGRLPLTEMLASASNLATFKIGDLFFIGYHEFENIKIGDRFELSSEGIESLICEIM